MRTIRRQLAAVLFAIFTLQTPAWATSFSTDQSDLRVEGSFNTSAGDAGSFVLVEINGQHTFWTARLGATSTSSGCWISGYLGGIRQ